MKKRKCRLCLKNRSLKLFTMRKVKGVTCPRVYCRDCDGVKRRQYDANNIDKARAYSRKYYSDNIERKRAYAREYYRKFLRKKT